MGARVVPAGTRERDQFFAQIEQGIGYYWWGIGARASERFRAALRLKPDSITAHELVAAATKLAGSDVPVAGPSTTQTRPPAPMSSGVAPMSSGVAPIELERQQRFVEALAGYWRLPSGAEVDAGMARCTFALGEFGHAIGHAQRVLKRDPHDAAMHALVMRAHLRRFRYADALAAAEARLADAPDDAAAHYTRGRGLLGLGRQQEARDAFERASTLDPKLLEAQLLYREVDRSLGRLRATVGAASAMTLDVPDHLPALRELIAGGRITEAIRLLRDLESDAVAQRIRGELLAFEARFADALDAFETSVARVDTPAAQLGRARALLSSSGRARHSRSSRDSICRKRPRVARARCSSWAAMPRPTPRFAMPSRPSSMAPSCASARHAGNMTPWVARSSPPV